MNQSDILSEWTKQRARRDRAQGVPLFQTPRIRLMRGQVVVRELDAPPSATLWTPDPTARQQRTHVGIVLGIGPHPAPGASHGYEVGARVQFHFGAVGTAAARTRAWIDGEPATWLTWEEIDAVWT